MVVKLWGWRHRLVFSCNTWRSKLSPDQTQLITWQLMLMSWVVHTSWSLLKIEQSLPTWPQSIFTCVTQLPCSIDVLIETNYTNEKMCPFHASVWVFLFETVFNQSYILFSFFFQEKNTRIGDDFVVFLNGQKPSYFIKKCLFHFSIDISKIKCYIQNPIFNSPPSRSNNWSSNPLVVIK